MTVEEVFPKLQGLHSKYSFEVYAMSFCSYVFDGESKIISFSVCKTEDDDFVQWQFSSNHEDEIESKLHAVKFYLENLTKNDKRI